MAFPSVSDDELHRAGYLHRTKRLPFREAPFWAIMQVIQAGIRPDATSDCPGIFDRRLLEGDWSAPMSSLPQLISLWFERSFQRSLIQMG
jgi:hypothetical protein